MNVIKKGIQRGRSEWRRGEGEGRKENVKKKKGVRIRDIEEKDELKGMRKGREEG